TDETRLTPNLPPLDPKRALAGDAPAPPPPPPFDPADSTGRGRTVMIGLWVGGAVVALLVLLGLTLGLKPPAEVKDDKGQPDAGGPGAPPWASARLALAKQPDLATCRAAMQQFGAQLAAPGAPRVPELTAGQAAGLQKLFGLDDAELAEVRSASFTGLDAYHLEACLLLRDAARSLELPGVGQTPLDRAAAAFDWVVRRVRREGAGGGEPLPPAYVLRRGWGSPLERALVFLALLEQFGQEDEARTGLQGCLLFLPEKGKEGRRLW